MEYLYNKYYLVSAKAKVVLPHQFSSVGEALSYTEEHGLKDVGYNMAMRGGDVKKLLDAGRIKEIVRFPLGLTVMSRGVADRVEADPEFAQFALESLRRHSRGDWGDLEPEDKRENEYSLDKRLRLFSAYNKWPLPKIWIITEADRSVTTTLFPEEY